MNVFVTADRESALKCINIFTMITESEAFWKQKHVIYKKNENNDCDSDL